MQNVLLCVWSKCELLLVFSTKHMQHYGYYVALYCSLVPQNVEFRGS